MRIFRTLALALAGMAGLAGTVPALADTIASTPSGVGYCRSGGCWSLYASQTLAAHFSVSSTTRITSILGWLAPGYDDTVTISLLEDNGAPGQGALPDQALHSASFAFSKLPGENDYYYSRWAGVTDLDWTISTGDYWISFAAQNPGNGAGTMGPFTGSSGSGFAFYNPGNGYWIRNDALNLGFQVIGDTGLSAAPEPASWALTIVGFGTIGATMRRRRGAALRLA